MNKLDSLQFMGWKECERMFIRRVDIDKERIKSIATLALKRFDFIKAVNVTDDNISFVVESYYEIVKELLVALFLKNGLKSDNHQCLITYFYKNYPKYEYEANLILRMSYLRNRLNYYGESIDLGFYEKHKEDFISIIEILNSLLKNENGKNINEAQVK